MLFRRELRWQDGLGQTSGAAAAIVCLLMVGSNPAWGRCRANEVTQLIASDAGAGDWAGWSVSTSGDVAVIGARHDGHAGTDSGSAYVYRFAGTGWTEEAKLTASDAAAGDEFGFSVAVSGDVAVIGAYWDDDAGTKSGSAYVYRFVQFRPVTQGFPAILTGAPNG